MDDLPYAHALGATPVAGDPTLLTLPFANAVVGRPGFLHGGAIGGFLEVASIVALRHALGIESDARIKPINLTVDFMRGGRDKPTFARGVVTRLGTRVANVDATAWQDDPARPIAAARMNYLIVRA
ncbi:PaaI family thioesterase [Sphingomonas sp. H39-1-10]|uniref:PaaI family thioesterase n=1 Tax=Sphingomonas TaxID=13687 RepID=UPI00088F9606|nr:MULTISPECIES: PaaI family thioesterase [Sphingomonas]MDF0487005.1 PaaI family thioesterase [Sphingomonas pollutisoli]SDA27002.1 Acyl-coenzyme A thioesterase PaaI, contains HGG motif [Sphingomonas sp. NFR15]